MRTGIPNLSSLKLITAGAVSISSTRDARLLEVLELSVLQPELRTILPLLRQSISFSKILFFHMLLLNGIT